MRKFFTDAEINDLASSLRQSYEKLTHQESNWCLDVVDMMEKLFQLKVKYASFAEDDMGKVGFLSDGVTPLWIYEKGVRKARVYPEDTVVIDSFLLRAERTAELNNVLGHEFGHKLMPIQAPGLAKACYKALMDSERNAGIEELREKLNLAEIYADKFSAALFMPRYLLDRALKKYNNGNYLTLYGNYMLEDEDKIKLQKMADRLGVRYEDLFNRFKSLKMFNKKPAEDFTDNILDLGVTM